MVFRQALQKVTEVDLEPLKTSEVVFFIQSTWNLIADWESSVTVIFCEEKVERGLGCQWIADDDRSIFFLCNFHEISQWMSMDVNG